MPRAKNKQKYDPGTLSARVYPLSLATLQRDGAACWERYLSSRSPPDHLLYQMLNTVPVCGGCWGLTCSGSTWARAGRRFRRIIFLGFFCAVVVSSVVAATARAVSDDEGLSCVRAFSSLGVGTGFWGSMVSVG